MKPFKGAWRRCGAKTKRTGLPCRARALANGRCKYHGGLSTGPKTPEGKARALANLKQYRNKGSILIRD
ncbi:MAG: hypothetical protein KAS93_02820 [Gammaproteobacteria bacterium]|nr:hypothetical protein [Gammaproteobacteria bacterium]